MICPHKISHLRARQPQATLRTGTSAENGMDFAPPDDVGKHQIYQVNQPKSAVWTQLLLLGSVHAMGLSENKVHPFQ